MTRSVHRCLLVAAILFAVLFLAYLSIGAYRYLARPLYRNQFQMAGRDRLPGWERYPDYIRDREGNIYLFDFHLNHVLMITADALSSAQAPLPISSSKKVTVDLGARRVELAPTKDTLVIVSGPGDVSTSLLAQDQARTVYEQLGPSTGEVAPRAQAVQQLLSGEEPTR